MPAADHQMTKDRQFALEAARALYYAQQRRNEMAGPLIADLLAQYADLPVDTHFDAWFQLADAAERTWSPAATNVIARLQEVSGASAHRQGVAAWLETRYAFNRGLPYEGRLARFIALCEEHLLMDLLSRAAREAAAVFLCGLEQGIASLLYPAVFPPFNRGTISPRGRLGGRRTPAPANTPGGFSHVVRPRRSGGFALGGPNLRPLGGQSTGGSRPPLSVQQSRRFETRSRWWPGIPESRRLQPHPPGAAH